MTAPKITKIEIESFTWEVKGLTHGRAFHYDPDSTLTRSASAIRITADNGAVGEYTGWGVAPDAVAEAAGRYLGQNPLDRERLYQSMKGSPTVAVYDIGLWDLAGKMMGLAWVWSTIGIIYLSTPPAGWSIPHRSSLVDSYGSYNREQCKQET